ncbi:MAG: polyphenol oxidase family protein [Acidimicrobiales bacterium]
MIERELPAGEGLVAQVRCTDSGDGDFHIDAEPSGLRRRRRDVAPGSWSWLRQVHGSRVVRVESAGDRAGAEADASATSSIGAVLVVQSADCAPVVLVNEGAIAVAHAGWRGLVAGVVARTIMEVRCLGEGPVRALIGPVIRPRGYEFGLDELDRVVAEVGEEARSVTASGRPALDLAAAVTSVLAAAGVEDVVDLGIDTSDPAWFSHRTRGDTGRQVTAVWLERR